MFDDDIFDSAMEAQMDRDAEPECEDCGTKGDNLTCGTEWDMEYCCAECADGRAWAEEEESMKEVDNE